MFLTSLRRAYGAQNLRTRYPRLCRGLTCRCASGARSVCVDAIEAVPRVTEKQRQVRMSCLDLFDFRWADIRILGVEMHHHDCEIIKICLRVERGGINRVACASFADGLRSSRFW